MPTSKIYPKVGKGPAQSPEAGLCRIVGDTGLETNTQESLVLLVTGKNIHKVASVLRTAGGGGKVCWESLPRSVALLLWHPLVNGLLLFNDAS